MAHGPEARRSEAGAPRRVPSLDGLRALACLAVFGVHVRQLTGWSGGWGVFDFGLLLANGNTGVCFFFLLSGMLMSLPFWREARQGQGGSSPVRLGCRRYLLRRWVRIAPPYYLCLAAILVARRFRVGMWDLLLHATFLHNFAEFSLYSLSPPLWAMAVIAQGYVLVPLVLRAMRPVLHRPGWAVGLLLALGAAGQAAHMVLSLSLQGGLEGAGSGATASLSELVVSHSLLAHWAHYMLGAALGVVFVRGPEAFRPAKAGETGRAADGLFGGCLLGLVVVLSVPSLDQALRIPFGRYNLPYVPLLVGGLVAAGPRGRVARAALDSPPLRGLGTISYGFYIYHLPCLKVTSYLLGRLEWSAAARPLLFAACGGALSAAVAGVSYRWLERPIRRVLAQRGTPAGGWGGHA